MERDVGIEEQQIERAQVNSAQSLTLIPGRSLYEITKLPSFADTFEDVPDVETRTREDVIAKGLVSLNDAEALYVKFKGLDQYVYSITLMHDSLSHVRQSSRLLTASICSVASLHNPNHDQTHLVCKQEFINLASSKAFSRHRSLDDIRALAIGAFWLHDVCVVLCAHAVQFASDLQVEHSLEQLLDPKVPEAKKVELYLRVRLWYLLYVCDHQFSIPHGRAPLVRENLAVREWERFLQSPLTIEADQRLVSQVHLWSIMARAYDRFGPNVYAPITNENFKHIRSFIVELDLLRIHWAVKFSVNEFIGNYPANGLILHHYFAKLYLCILAFRRRSESAQPLGLDIGPESAEFGSEAITCARGIIQIIVQDEELHGMLVGMPLYFDTMITFAAIFLLSVALFSQGRFEISEASTFGVVGQLVTILQRQSAYASRHHILSRIAPGLLSFLRGCENRAGSHYSPLIPASGQGEQVDGRYFFPTSYGDLLGQLGNFKADLLEMLQIRTPHFRIFSKRTSTRCWIRSADFRFVVYSSIDFYVVPHTFTRGRSVIPDHVNTTTDFRAGA